MAARNRLRLSRLARNRFEELPHAPIMGTITAQIQLTDAELKLLQTLVYQECGMFFDERRSHFLKDRLLRRLKACQLDSFYNYYRLLTSREGKNELALLLENLTVNETSFFRNRPQLDLLQKGVLEEILRKKQERRDWTLRVWSAGCSSGQEPFSVAILICDALAYYYLRNPRCRAAQCELNIGAVTSRDQGRTWQVQGPLNDAPMRVNWLPNTNEGLMFGDYISTSFPAHGGAVTVVPVASAPVGLSLRLSMFAARPGP